MISLLRALCALCGIFFVLGCGQEKASTDQHGSNEQSPPSTDQALVASVGDTPIDLSTLQAIAAREGLNLHDEADRAKTIDEAIDFEILADLAESEGYFDDPEITRMIKKMAVGKLLRDRLDTPAADLPAPSEQELRDYYDANKADFSQPALLRAQTLRVPAEKSDAVQEAITNIGEKPFGNLVAEHSTDPAARANGGMSNWIIEGRPNKRYPDALVQALFAAENGSVVGPVESPQGTWFAKLAEKRPGRTTSFEEAKGRIGQELTRSKRRTAYEKLVNDLRAEADIKQFPEQLESAIKAQSKPSGPPPGPPGTR